ncbi:carbon-nitrogen hydrolase family protein [Vallitalea guaymasensis]|uniref:carbon-nitrogen hydrolase family protein n=1 Tax=Vallitalea guaymasensis TaxID=1185412 RepID=UPI002354EB1F|nr:carbon-nitrogen hydrolase family protein [Vallitalea guaymasensis]
MNKKVEISFIQFGIEADPFESAVVETNVNKVCAMIDELEPHTMDLIILPDEIFGAYAYGPMNIPLDLENEYLDKIKEKAKEYSIYIAGSIMAKQDYISSYSKGFLIDRQGELVFEQNRNNVFAQETRFVIKNQDEIKVYETDFGKIALCVGIDILFPQISQQLINKEIDIIISPNMYYGKNEETNELGYSSGFFRVAARARAMENQAFVLMSNSTGINYHTDEQMVGKSMVVYPNGKYYETDQREGSYSFELDLANCEDKYMSVYDLKTLADVNSN